MTLDRVHAGRDLPDIVNIIIEIPANSDPVKYEFDEETGAMFVDRFPTAPMRYPCNYGYIPQTLSGDGDPCDVLLVTPYPVLPGTVVQSRPIGVLKVTDQSGDDPKILAVPIGDVCSMYDDVECATDLPDLLLNQIVHLFEHYKDLDEGKWSRVDGWKSIEAAKQEIKDAATRWVVSRRLVSQ